MPAYRTHKVLEVARGIKAFVRFDVGLTRGSTPNPEQQADIQERELHQARARVNKQSQELKRLRKLLSREGKRPARTKEQRSVENGRTQDEGQDPSYEELYETRIRTQTPDTAIGASRPFNLVGKLEIQVLLNEGLKPTDTLVDLGCGTGRLAIHAIPTLGSGRYTGIDIAQTMLDDARKRVEEILPNRSCEVSWMHQTTPVFALETDSVDMLCAFSVINHMEHEDAYLYLKDALRIVRPGGRFVFSCLPIDTKRGQEIFLKSAGVDLLTRHRRVLHVATSRDLMESIIRMAGWTPVRWYNGDEKNIELPDDGELYNFNQSIYVIEAPSNNGAVNRDNPA